MLRKIVSLVNIVCVMILGITIYIDNNPSFAQGKFGEGMRDSIAPKVTESYNHLAALSEENANAAALSGFEFSVSLTGEVMGRDFSASRSLTHCKATLYQVLNSLPKDHISKLKYLTLNMSGDGNRGLGGSNSMILRCLSVTDPELTAVVVHEVGHIVDLGLLEGTFFSGKSEFADGTIPIYNDDLSLGFYRISWKDSYTLKEGSAALDFVTGYAMKDSFEDFAESYIMYALHGTEFRMMARANDALQAKYDYLQEHIFDNKEFVNLAGDFSASSRQYDSTLIPYDLEKFLTR